MTSSAVSTLNTAKLQIGNSIQTSNQTSSVESFRDVMNTASRQSTGTEPKVKDASDLKQTDSEPNVQESKDAKQPVEPEKDMSTDATETTETTDTTQLHNIEDDHQPEPEVLAAMENLVTAILSAAEQIVNRVAEAMDVSSETVIASMNELNMTDAALLDPENVKLLMLNIAGDAEGTTLLTDETLYGNVQDLMNLSKDLMTQITEGTTLSQEDVTAVLEFTAALEETIVTGRGEEALTQISDLFTSKQMTGEGNAPEMMQTPENAEGKDIRVTFERRLDMTQNSSISGSEVAETETETLSSVLAKSDAQGATSDTESGLSGYLQTFLQNLTQVTENLTQEVSQISTIPDTEQFLQEVLDYMRVHVGEETTDLEMQLHPESLGTLNIHLTSREGAVTAQFVAQNEDVRAALQSQLLELRAVLENQGVKIDAVEVTVSDFGEHMGQEQSQAGEGSADGQPQKRGTRRIDLSLLSEDEMTDDEKITAEMMKANGTTVDYTA